MPSSCRGNPDRRQHIVARDALDAGELILGRHLANRDQLHAIFLSARRVQEQIPEVAGAARILQRLAQPGNVVFVHLRIRQIQDKTGVGSVGVVPAAEQRGRFVQ